MAFTRTAISRNHTMLEQYREMESSLSEVSKWLGRTAGVLSGSGSPAPETYLSAIGAIRALQEALARHLEIERVLFPRMLCRNLLSAEFLERTAASNRAIKKQLDAILSAPWPRSAQAGLQSMQSGASKTLTQLLAHIESEQSLILPAILRMDSRKAVAVRVRPEISECLENEGRLPGRELVTSGNPPLFTSSMRN